jgi:acrylyl-CoA reductase (NADPH)
VAAVTGRPAESAYLEALGASAIVDRASLSQPGKPLQRERWAGAIDVAGGHVLANLCAQTRYHGTVAACGLAQSMEFPASVAPFILRGVTLAGIDSVMAPLPRREAAWQRLVAIANRPEAAAITRTIGLGEVIGVCPDILSGTVRGRLVVAIG